MSWSPWLLPSLGSGLTAGSEAVHLPDLAPPCLASSKAELSLTLVLCLDLYGGVLGTCLLRNLGIKEKCVCNSPSNSSEDVQEGKRWKHWGNLGKVCSVLHVVLTTFLQV